MEEPNRISGIGERGKSEYDLYVAPPAGCGPIGIAAHLEKVPPAFQVHLIRLPGRESRIDEPAARSVEEAAGDVLHDLAVHVASRRRPYAFLGICYGALISLHLATRLWADENVPDPDLLIVVDQPVPFGIGMSDDERAMVTSDDYVLRELERRGIDRADVEGDAEILEMFRAPIVADFTAAERYGGIGGRKLVSDLLVIGGSTPGSTAAWQEVTDGDVSASPLPAGVHGVDAIAQAVAMIPGVLPSMRAGLRAHHMAYNSAEHGV